MWIDIKLKQLIEDFPIIHHPHCAKLYCFKLIDYFNKLNYKPENFSHNLKIYNKYYWHHYHNDDLNKRKCLMEKHFNLKEGFLPDHILQLSIHSNKSNSLSFQPIRGEYKHGLNQLYWDKYFLKFYNSVKDAIFEYEPRLRLLDEEFFAYSFLWFLSSYSQDYKHLRNVFKIQGLPSIFGCFIYCLLRFIDDRYKADCVLGIDYILDEKLHKEIIYELVLRYQTESNYKIAS